MNPQRGKVKNVWNRTNHNQNQSSNQKPKSNKTPSQKNEDKLRQAQEKLQEAVKRHANDYESSEEEDNLEKDNIISNVLQQYAKAGANADIGRTQNFLQDAFQSGTCTCLICISSIKRDEAIWTCNECYCFFHLMCIQRWSKDTITQHKQAFEAQVQTKRITMKWGCPKCRAEYDPTDIPKDYFCFCKKRLNPSFEALIVPHSCGETCGRELRPHCGHKCLLLCHPGPCPPCPQTVKTTCYCGTSPTKFQRCTNKAWSCGATCNKLLVCGKHKCSQVCHEGDCPPCVKKSMQKCLCNRGFKLCDCAAPVWQCEKVCGQPFSCGHHKCEVVCHAGECGDCPREKIRTCNCGKNVHQLPCTEEVPTCGDTCGKTLDCEMHVCYLRCHKGKCQMCLETVTKSCRCGQHMKEVQCGKPYLCESKCKQMKDCNKHPCNRKCCDGNCPPCEKPCGKTLSCKKHSCASICHQGPCYPCNLTEKVACFCGGTTISVPCGRKTRTKPPKCTINCKTPPDCHHKQREPHNCHFGDCPPCKQICDKKLKCPHNCLAKCHSAVLVKLQQQKAATPWDEKGPQVEKRSLPCPPCPVPVPITCFGRHETCDYRCCDARPMSCHKPCGRRLACNNHNCSFECHVVEGAKDEISAGSNCEQCEYACDKPRVEGCTHKCGRGRCHPGECPPCKSMLKIFCYCGQAQPYVVCNVWTTTGDKVALQSCGEPCPLNFPCGHRCRSNCHSGECPNADQCKKKVKVFCKCKTIKKEHPCDVVRAGGIEISCDDTCKQKLLEDEEQKRLKNEEKQRLQEEQNKRELEKFEKMFAKKKSRDRKVAKEVVEDNNTKKYILIGACSIVTAVILYFVLY